MSFGVIGIIPLIIVYRLIRRLERERAVPVAQSSVQVLGG
jgi:hypothetical protein